MLEFLMVPLCNHPIYTLVAREGIGESPSSVDSTYLSYEGLLLNKSILTNQSLQFGLTLHQC
jgi:hypothetical protein